MTGLPPLTERRAFPDLRVLRGTGLPVCPPWTDTLIWAQWPPLPRALSRAEGRSVGKPPASSSCLFPVCLPGEGAALSETNQREVTSCSAARGHLMRRRSNTSRRGNPEGIKRPGPKLLKDVQSWAWRRGAAAATDPDLSLRSAARGLVAVTSQSPSPRRATGLGVSPSAPWRLYTRQGLSCSRYKALAVSRDPPAQGQRAHLCRTAATRP